MSLLGQGLFPFFCFYICFYIGASTLHDTIRVLIMVKVEVRG